MPRITIQMIEGRSQDQKRQLVKEVTDVVTKICDVDPTAVTILIEDMPINHFAKAGVFICDNPTHKLNK